MTVPPTITITLLLISLTLIAVLSRTKTIGPVVMVGVVLGGCAGVAAMSLLTSWI